MRWCRGRWGSGAGLMRFASHLFRSCAKASTLPESLDTTTQASLMIAQSTQRLPRFYIQHQHNPTQPSKL
jgi:hypothetical protein